MRARRISCRPFCGRSSAASICLAGVDEKREQSWFIYAIAMIAFSIAGFVSLYALQRLQNVLPLNPQGFDAVPADLAFNTSISFITNTNWQNYGGETTMSHLTQMLGLTVHNFLSAATGLAMAFALVRALRALVRDDGRQFLGRYDPRRSLYPAADLDRRRSRFRRARRAADAGRLGRRHDARRRQADHLDRPDGEPGSDQGARHQRRRLHERQFGASVRESQRLDEHPRDLAALAGPDRFGARLRPRCRRLAAGPRDPDHDGDSARRRRRRRLLGGERGNFGRDRARRRSVGRQYGRQGGPLRAGPQLAVRRQRRPARARARSSRCTIR